MCAYNKLNGPYSCENAEVQNDIVRERLDFRGFINSDWGATHSSEAITRGLDLEMPGPREGTKTYFTEPLADAIRSGKIPAAALDEAVGHILYEMDEFHMLHGERAAASASIDITADAQTAQSIAEKSAVLLKNDDNILPLKSSDLDSLLLVGPTAGQLAVGAGGERGYGFEQRFVSPLNALRQAAAGAQAETKINYLVGDDLTGISLSGSVLSHDGMPGLLRRQTTPATGDTASDDRMDFNGASALAPGTAYTWTGTLTVPAEGNYTFMLQAAVGDGANGNGGITLDGRKVFTARGGVVPPGFGGLDEGPNGAIVKKWASLLPTTDGRNNPRVTLHLTAGPHPIEITASSTGRKPLPIRFNWMTPAVIQSNIEKAVSAAKSAHTVVVFAWSLGGNNLALPDEQDVLIQKISAANPRTIVVLNAGFAIAMAWKGTVRAVLDMWYPGQEGGEATANLLTGRVNPSGKLPFTMPAKLDDSPAYAPGHPERVPQSAGGGADAGDVPLAKFSEGIAVGYRWFDQQNIEPLFPFGYGLSYTQFKYSGLRISPGRDGCDVAFSITNAGGKKGAEVPQVYVGPPGEPPVAMAPKSLAAFDRVELNPGETKILNLHVSARAFSYWSSSQHQWALVPGSRPIYVGSSSRDIRLQGKT